MGTSLDEYSLPPTLTKLQQSITVNRFIDQLKISVTSLQSSAKDEEINFVVDQISHRINSFPFSALAESLYALLKMKEFILRNKTSSSSVEAVEIMTDTVLENMLSLLWENRASDVSIAPKYFALFLFSMISTIRSHSKVLLFDGASKFLNIMMKVC